MIDIFLLFSEFVVVTSISTATIEALFSKKKVIYIDPGFRKKSKYFCDLESLIKIIPLRKNYNLKDLKENLEYNIKSFDNSTKDYEEKLKYFYNESSEIE